MKNYLTIESEAQAEISVKRSKFIAFVSPISDTSDAEKRLGELKDEYADATHICYAYIADELGNVKKFSDNGEPQGTAGLPILSALEGRGLKKCFAAVVRYFGGIKLGANGLVGAYSEAVAAALEKSRVINEVYCSVFEAKANFADAEAIKKSKILKIIEAEYGDYVTLRAVAPRDCGAEKIFADATAGRAIIKVTGEGWFTLE